MVETEWKEEIKDEQKNWYNKLIELDEAKKDGDRWKVGGDIIWQLRVDGNNKSIAEEWSKWNLKKWRS